MYFTDPVDNAFSRGLKALDENGQPEKVDQSKLPGVKALFSPRAGFNWDVTGDRSTQLRGGSGIFTGRLPFVWVGNVISNPGPNPNLYPSGPQIKTSDDAILQQSYYTNVMDPDFRWPQVWTTNVAVDQKLPWDLLGTLEVLYSKDINATFMRNADLPAPTRALPIDNRPYYANGTLNPGLFGGGIYVIDNSSEGYNYSITTQLRKIFDFGLTAGVSYTFLEAKSQMKSTEIASVLWAENPVKGNPNKPELSYSEFGNRHRIIGTANYRHEWSENLATSVGMFLEVADGNRFAGAGGNRYSFIYSGDVNGDGQGGNDLIYIPRNQSEIIFDPIKDASGKVTSTPDQQWAAFNAFIEQDDYLKSHRGQIAERFGASNPWFSNIDLRILQDFSTFFGGRKHTLQLSVDILNVANLFNSDWGVRKVANAAATSPLKFLDKFTAAGAPVFNFTGPAETFIDDPGLYSRWQIQVGLRYSF